MRNIGIFGAENSHAMAFSRFFNLEHPEAGWRVSHIGGEEEAAARKIMEECGVQTYAERPGQMLGSVDAAMITSREGALHLRYACPFLEAGLPTFVDKPLTRDIAEALQLTALAEKSGAPLMGGSSVKLVDGIEELREAAGGAVGGSVYAPVSMDNPYGGFWFYSAHLCEVALAVFGPEIVSVAARRTEGGVFAALRYPGFDVGAHFLEGVYHYGASVYTQKGPVSRVLDLGDCYARECRLFVRMAEGGPQMQSFSDLRRPVEVLDAILRSFETGREQKVG